MNMTVVSSYCIKVNRILQKEKIGFISLVGQNS